MVVLMVYVCVLLVLFNFFFCFLSGGILPVLVNNFEPTVCIQNIGDVKSEGNSYQVSSRDVQDVFLLPRCVGNKITLSSDSKLKDEFKSSIRLGKILRRRMILYIVQPLLGISKE